MVSEIALLSTLEMPIRISGAHKTSQSKKSGRPATVATVFMLHFLYAGQGGAVNNEF